MTFLYKCRRCGVIERNQQVHGNSMESWHKCIALLGEALCSPHGTTRIAMTGIHACDSYTAGVSDLIGFEPER